MDIVFRTPKELGLKLNIEENGTTAVENAMGLAALFLLQLGYRAENVNAWGWSDYESEQQFYRIAEREKLPVIQLKSVKPCVIICHFVTI